MWENVVCYEVSKRRYYKENIQNKVLKLQVGYGYQTIAIVIIIVL